MADNPFDFTDPDERKGYYARPVYRPPGRPVAAGFALLFLMLLSLALGFFLWPFFLLYFFAYALAIVWVAADTQGEPSAPLWIILVVIAGPLGLLAYLVQRPQ